MAERPAENPALPAASSAAPAPSVANLPTAADTAAADTAVADTAFASAPLVVIGFSGVRFSHIDRVRTPNLADFLENSAAANLVVRTRADTTCPAAGWLTLASGARASLPDSATFCMPAVAQSLPAPYQIPHWGEIAAANRDNPYHPELGKLAAQLRQHSISAGGIGPGAGLALADHAGIIYGKYAGVPRDNDGFKKAYQQVKEKSLVIIDAGAAWENSPPAASALPPRLQAALRAPHPDSPQFLAQVAEIDARLGELLPLIPSTHHVLLLSVADGDSQTARMQFFALRRSGALAAAGAGKSAGANAGDSGESSAESSAGASAGARENPASQISIGPALAESLSTRQPGVVQLTDILPTITQLLGAAAAENAAAGENAAAAQNNADKPSLTGASSATDFPLQLKSDQRSGEARAAYLADKELRAALVRSGVAPFYCTFGLGAIAALLAVLLYRRAQRKSFPALPPAKIWPLPPALFYFCIFIAALPLSTFLLNLFPWWRLARAEIWQLPLLLIFAAALALLIVPARRCSPRAPASIIAALSASTLAIDALCGSPLHFSSLLGDQPQSGGRFYGFSNAPFVVFALSLLFTAGVLLEYLRRKSAPASLRVAVVVILAILGIFIDGAPQIGADFGGPPALFLAFLTLFFLSRSRGFRLYQLCLAFLGGALGMFGVAYLDWRRPPAVRSHFGKFFAQLIDGKGGEVVMRKITQLLTSVPFWAWGIGIAIALGIGWGLWNYRRKIRAITRGQAENFPLSGDIFSAGIAGLVVLLCGMLINDSGLVMLCIGLCYGVPLWLSCFSAALPTNAAAPPATHPHTAARDEVGRQNH